MYCSAIRKVLKTSEMDEARFGPKDDLELLLPDLGLKETEKCVEKCVNEKKCSEKCVDEKKCSKKCVNVPKSA